MHIERTIRNTFKYRELLKQLVIRDLKVKYKRSILGILWSLLNPLLNMIIITIVFSQLFKFNIENFAAYVISGQILFTFFSESTSTAMGAIYSSGQLIKKVYIPRFVFPVSKIIYSLVNFSFSLIATLLVCIITGVEFNFAILNVVISIAYVLLFSLGVGLALCSIVVFFRDVEHFYGIFLTAWMYATPIIYPASIMPDKYLFLFYCNPMYYFLLHFRTSLIDGIVPSWELNLHCFSYAVITFIVGAIIFQRNQQKFILHI